MTTLVLYVSKLLATGASFFIHRQVLAQWGSLGYSNWYLSLQWSVVFTFIADANLNTLAPRFMNDRSAVSNERAVNELLSYRLFWTSISAVLFVVAFSLSDHFILYPVLFSIVATGFNPDWVLRLNRQYRTIAIRQLLVSFLQILGLLILGTYLPNSTWFIWMYFSIILVVNIPYLNVSVFKFLNSANILSKIYSFKYAQLGFLFFYINWAIPSFILQRTGSWNELALFGVLHTVLAAISAPLVILQDVHLSSNGKDTPKWLWISTFFLLILIALISPWLVKIWIDDGVVQRYYFLSVYHWQFLLLTLSIIVRFTFLHRHLLSTNDKLFFYGNMLSFGIHVSAWFILYSMPQKALLFLAFSELFSAAILYYCIKIIRFGSDER